MRTKALYTNLFRYVLMATAIILLVVMAGCGGAVKSSGYLPVDDQLFVPNYVSSLPGLYHWPRLPLKISFDLPSNWQNLYPGNEDLHLRAADVWNQPDRQAFVSVVPMGSSTDVGVRFVNQSELGGNSQGITEYTYDSTGLMRSASIKIALYNTRGRLISASDARAVIAHEIGHALGIAGHSPNSTDLMYATITSGITGIPSICDLNTAMTAYPGYFCRSAMPETRSLPTGPVTIMHDTIH